MIDGLAADLIFFWGFFPSAVGRDVLSLSHGVREKAAPLRSVPSGSAVAAPFLDSLTGDSALKARGRFLADGREKAAIEGQVGFRSITLGVPAMAGQFTISRTA